MSELAKVLLKDNLDNRLTVTNTVSQTLLMQLRSDLDIEQEIRRAMCNDIAKHFADRSRVTWGQHPERDNIAYTAQAWIFSTQQIMDLVERAYEAGKQTKDL